MSSYDFAKKHVTYIEKHKHDGQKGNKLNRKNIKAQKMLSSPY